ncbi:MAG: isoprenylcysteine carboxylmethyltransferase family protein, partial [Gammaproteobacteria bacterium]|nr:isoprenylcysteine carboxylmethyltransferase family protein [Gammaproteobacteria bacterium]
MGRFFGLLYGGICYVITLFTLVYMFFFLTNVWVLKGVDDGEVIPIPQAVMINIGLILLFGLQHSIMARPGFKKIWTRVIPKTYERSTYVLASSLVLAFVFWQWQPIQVWLWGTSSALGYSILYGLFMLGTIIVLASTFMTDHFDLFGVRQVWLNLWGRPYTHQPFQARWFYRFMRHPLYFGLLLMLWSTPRMSYGHALFSLGMTMYILIGVRYEERDL